MFLGSTLEPLQRWAPSDHGDNYWLDIISTIADKVDVVVAPIVGTPSKRCPLPMVAALPSNIERWGNLAWKLESNYVIKNILFTRAYRWIERTAKDLRIDQIHFIENYGPIQKALSRINVAKSITQTHYDPRYPFYDAILRTSLEPFDAIVTGSQHLALRLRERCTTKVIRSIPWAVSFDRLNNEPTNGKANSKARFGLKADSKVVLWSGFISVAAEERELNLCLKLAKQLVGEIRNLEFVFAFKRHWNNLARAKYKQLEGPGIHIMPLQSRAEFLELVRASDLLFSPCLNKEAIIGVPLTWLECMALGVPIVTTNVPALDEVISNNRNGILLSDLKQAPEVLCQLLHDPADIERLSIGARNTIRSKFGIERAADAYLSLWSSIVR